MLCSAIPRIFDKIDKLQRMVEREREREVLKFHSLVFFLSFFVGRRKEKKGENYGDRLTIKKALS
jgi:hypothetical protein